jgi:hypothetical protein
MDHTVTMELVLQLLPFYDALTPSRFLAVLFPSRFLLPPRPTVPNYVVVSLQCSLVLTSSRSPP